MEQGFVRAHRQIHLQIRTAQLHTHYQARHGFQRQRVKRTDAQPSLADTGNLARLFQPALHHLHHLLTILQQRPCGGVGNQVTPFVSKERAADVLF